MSKTDAFYAALEARLIMNAARGVRWITMVALLCGYSMKEIALRLGIPETSLRRAIGKERAA